MGPDILQLIYHIDGKSSVVDIAGAVRFSFSKTLEFLRILEREKLITWKE